MSYYYLYKRMFWFWFAFIMIWFMIAPVYWTHCGALSHTGHDAILSPSCGLGRFSFLTITQWFMSSCTSTAQTTGYNHWGFEPWNLVVVACIMHRSRSLIQEYFKTLKSSTSHHYLKRTCLFTQKTPITGIMC